MLQSFVVAHQTTVIEEKVKVSHMKISFSLTLSVSAFFPAIFEKDSPTFFTRRMNPAPLRAAVSLDLGNYIQEEIPTE